MEAALSPRTDNISLKPPTGPSQERARGQRNGHSEIPLRFVPVLAADSVGEHATGADIMPRRRSERVSRAVNFVVAATALVATAPALLLIAALVKITSRGPVLYSQTRVGLDRRYLNKSSNGRRSEDQGGKPFTMYKFRTMCVDAEPDGKAVWAQSNDPRVTRIGAALRRMRLDELPQLYNVLLGDMNIVGPRPERPSIFAEMRREIPEYPLRQRVKPGITGWAQVNQAYDTSLDDVRNKVRLDLEYLTRQSMAEDLRIMSRTIPVMLFRRGGW